MTEDLENTQKTQAPVLLKKKKIQNADSVQNKDNSGQKQDEVSGENRQASGIAQASGTKEAGKKKVVVVKRKPAAKPVDGSDTQKSAPKGNSVSVNEKNGTPEKTAKTEKTVFELSPQRPNIKQGNLADNAKPSSKGGRTGQFQNQQGKGSGYSGFQAREGAQQKPFNQRGGFSQGKPGYQGNRGNFQGQRGNAAGGKPGYQGNNKGFQQGQQRDRGGFSSGGFGRSGGFSQPVIPVETQKVNTKKTFKAKKTVYSKKNKEDLMAEEKLLQQKKKQVVMANPVPKEIEIMETVSISELAKKMNLKASDLIGKLMTMGMMVSINQSIDADTATLLADEYGCEVHIISLYDETVIESDADSSDELLPRPPVVTVMGHVDHGKTKTLDAIRSAHVAESEFGGITQHIGAYMVDTPKGKITFLDTPGHEAFTMMRARGAQITDIVVLVVAADDGVMPQTVEALNHAKDAKVPIIVAVNKIDKPEANPDRVKTQLSELGLTPEEWGGQTMFINISALKREGIDDLLDAILLQAEMLELKANYSCRAEGKILESKIDHGRGIVSTVVIERGTLRMGDPYVAGIYSGRVRALFNDRGEKIEEATPSMPVEILGFEGMPNAGDPFQVTDSERSARQFSAKRQELRRFEDAKNVKKITLDNLYDTIQDGEMMEFKVVIKADVQGSAEALKQSLEKLSTKDIRLSVIHASAGAINESDVMLAAADSNAIIIGFNVRPSPQAKVLAEQEKVDIRKYNVIYKAVEEITQAMEGMLKPEIKEETIGSVEVRDTFKVPKVGIIAGCYVTSGVIRRNASVNVIREGIVIHTGKISSLKHLKDDAKELAAGYECGVGLADWQDIKVGDQFEVFELVEVARKLKDTKAEE